MKVLFSLVVILSIRQLFSFRQYWFDYIGDVRLHHSTCKLEVFASYCTKEVGLGKIRMNEERKRERFGDLKSRREERIGEKNSS